jgi:hypothetical protein
MIDQLDTRQAPGPPGDRSALTLDECERSVIHLLGVHYAHAMGIHRQDRRYTKDFGRPRQANYVVGFCIVILLFPLRLLFPTGDSSTGY